MDFEFRKQVQKFLICRTTECQHDFPSVSMGVHPWLIVFPLNPHLSCGHPLPFPRARNLAPFRQEVVIYANL
jgi:hypothetical protein